jgi:recombination protein RecA
MSKLQDAIKGINKTYGENAVLKLGESNLFDVEVIPTGSIALDKALQIGGLPRGRVTEIFGWESSGKTTLAIHAIAECQKQGGTCAIIDAEHAFDRGYAASLGVNVDDLFISQPTYAEEALEIMEKLISTGEIDLVVLDSVAALTPRAEVEGEMGDSQIGLLARLMGKAMRKLVGPISKTKTCVIFINQLRLKIGVMFGNPETTTGGNALKFATSVRIRVHGSTEIKEGDKAIGKKLKVKVDKLKLGSPSEKVEIDLMYGKGFSREGEVLDFAVEYGIVERKGSWFKYGDTQLTQGRTNAITLLEDNPELMDELEKKVMSFL